MPFTSPELEPPIVGTFVLRANLPVGTKVPLTSPELEPPIVGTFVFRASLPVGTNVPFTSPELEPPIVGTFVETARLPESSLLSVAVNDSTVIEIIAISRKAREEARIELILFIGKRS